MMQYTPKSLFDRVAELERQMADLQRLVGGGGAQGAPKYGPQIGAPLYAQGGSGLGIGQTALDHTPLRNANFPNSLP